MNKKLIKTALITSPVISLYGVIPVFIYNKLSFPHFIVGFVSSTLMIFAFWMFNIFLIQKNLKTLSRYIISYLVTFFLHYGLISFNPDFGGQENLLNFLIYPFVATTAINSIILIILNSELIKRKKDLAESEVQRLKVVNLEAQKQVLLQQLQPHFLFNALSTLKSLIKYDAEAAEDYVFKLSEFLRYSVHAHINELVSVQEELRFAQDYIELQKMRFGDAFYCEIKIPENVFSMKIPVFALQTLIENALKHNSFTENKPLFISVSAEGKKLKISNNKIPKPLLQKSGTGLINLNERYKLVAGNNIEIFNNESEFVVFLMLIEK